jgi:Arc/MetJ family transcription regulator
LTVIGGQSRISAMRRHTTLDLDPELIREAAAALGTTRTTETVHAALAEVVARRRRAMLARLDLPDLTPEAVWAMRAPRHAETAPDVPALRVAQDR